MNASMTDTQRSEYRTGQRCAEMLEDKMIELGPRSMKELEDPAFLQHLKQTQEMPMVPDPQDFNVEMLENPPDDPVEQSKEYQLAVARKIIRLYRVWKLSQK